MRTSDLLLRLAAVTLLAGCTKSPSDAAAESGRGGETIACQVAGAGRFEKVCLVDRTASQEGLVLTVRHPDGSFRRLLATRDGRGVVAADGAEKAVVTVTATNEIEVALAGDRYRLPATVKASAPAGQ